jgi:DNA-binding GntR family transcriptional regulator
MVMRSSVYTGDMENQSSEALVSRGDAELLRTLVSSLEEDIVLGRLHPRERLIEDELMRRFAAKRHVVRRALADLQQMGIVERLPNRGALVRAYQAEEIQQLYVLRNLLEGHAAALVPMPLSELDVGELKAVQARHDHAVASGDLTSVFRVNLEFHELLFSKSGNAYLVEAIRQFAQRTHGIRFYCLTYPGYLEQARREHWEMIAAIETGDRQSLVRLCHHHLLASRQCYEKAVGIQSRVFRPARRSTTSSGLSASKPVRSRRGPRARRSRLSGSGTHRGK